MTFVNERLSEEDRKKYRIDELEKKEKTYNMNFKRWVADKDREIFLMSTGLNKEAGRTFWLYFHGCLFKIITNLKIDNKTADEEWYEIYSFSTGQNIIKITNDIISAFSEALNSKMSLSGNNNNLKITKIKGI